MRKIPDTFRRALASEITSLCLCWEITRADKQRFGLTDHDADIQFGGLRYHANSGLRASALDARVGLSTQGMEVSGVIGGPVLQEGDLQKGLFDNARVSIWLVDWRAPKNRMTLLNGAFGRIKNDNGVYSAELLAQSVDLNRTIGRVYQGLCDAELGDTRCRVNMQAARYRFTTTIRAVNRETISCDAVTAQQDWFTGGFIVLSDNSQMRVRSDAIGSNMRLIGLWQQPKTQLVVGDQVTLVAGCDKRPETCRAKFANFINFQGFPDMPSQEQALAVQKSG